MGGPRFDESIPFKGLRIAVMTVSDTRNEQTDKSGAYLVERAQEAGHHVMDKVIIVDDRKRIEVQLRRWINEAAPVSPAATSRRKRSKRYGRNRSPVLASSSAR